MFEAGDKVRLSMQGRQIIDKSTTDTNCINTIATVGVDKNGMFFQYDEAVEGAKNGISNKIYVLDTEVEYYKRGLVNADIYLKGGETFPLNYRTPCGTLEMLIKTNKLHIRKNQKAIYVKSEYTMWQSRELVSTNLLSITITVIGECENV